MFLRILMVAKCANVKTYVHISNGYVYASQKCNKAHESFVFGNSR